ncbi:hypothetical protein HanOQP8_Chr05g0193101 [Helianthus annuus]|nr:hypothetical protein HanOQP8_Chr05g0193101 [Helianthus annuus]
MCLMMLSKDSANCAGVNSVVESSDNNSAVLETKSSSVERISKKSSGGLDADTVQFENLTARKVESDISVEELLRYGDPNKKSKWVFDKAQELTYEQNLEIRRNLFREFTYLKKKSSR